MSAFKDIQTILDTRLAALPGRPPIAWPNIKFNPAQSQVYLRPTLLPAASSLYTLNEYDQHLGIYQIDVYVAAEKGNGVVLGMMDDIRDYFKSEMKLSNGNTDVFIQAISMGQIIRENSWTQGVIEIQYLCYA